MRIGKERLVFMLAGIGVCILIQTNFALSQQREILPETSSLLEKNALSQSFVGISVVRMKDGAEIEKYQAHKNFIPASTLKLLYSLVAVDQLGPGFRYETRILYSGEIVSDGSLEGDIIISSSGDPAFGSDRFQKGIDTERIFRQIFQKIKEKGIRCIDGNIVLHLPYISYPVCGSWPWEDLGNYYASGAWGFNFNENSLDVKLISPAREGLPCRVIGVEPDIPFIKMESLVLSGSKKSGDNAYIFGAPFDFQRIIMGTIPSGMGTFTISGSLPDPPGIFASMLSGYLEKNGISNEGFQVTAILSGSPRLISRHMSKPLLEIAGACNDYSINLYAEALGKLIYWKVNHEMPAQYPGEADWESLFVDYGVDPASVHIIDACGLSPQNLISPEQMTRFLVKMYAKLGEENLLELLPQAGKNGLARGMLKNSTVQGQLWLKSGTIANVQNYAGVFRASSDRELYAFAIFTNHSGDSRPAIRSGIENYLEKLILETGK